MTKQKEIREKTEAWVDNRFGVPNTFNLQLLWDYLRFLDSQDVAIKVDRELGEGEEPFIKDFFYEMVKTYLDKAGYGAFEPLIKEE